MRDMVGDDDVDLLTAQLVDRLDGGARGVDDDPETAQQLGELPECLDLRMCHQSAKPPSHERHYIGGNPPRNG
jgi:hypothetical protein